MFFVRIYIIKVKKQNSALGGFIRVKDVFILLYLLILTYKGQFGVIMNERKNKEKRTTLLHSHIRHFLYE